MTDGPRSTTSNRQAWLVTCLKSLAAATDFDAASHFEARARQLLQWIEAIEAAVGRR